VDIFGTDQDAAPIDEQHWVGVRSWGGPKRNEHSGEHGSKLHLFLPVQLAFTNDGLVDASSEPSGDRDGAEFRKRNYPEAVEDSRENAPGFVFMKPRPSQEPIWALGISPAAGDTNPTFVNLLLATKRCGAERGRRITDGSLGPSVRGAIEASRLRNRNLHEGALEVDERPVRI
jgi:hypothetical protein